MAEGKIYCIVCDSVILKYYNESYKGKRGKCIICDTDFPLE